VLSPCADAFVGDCAYAAGHRGLTTAEIANAYLVPETTMAQRISRAKQRIKTSGVRFRMPSDRERADRLGAVLHVLYLTFNEATRAALAHTCSAPIYRMKRFGSPVSFTSSFRTMAR